MVGPCVVGFPVDGDTLVGLFVVGPCVVGAPVTGESVVGPCVVGLSDVGFPVDGDNVEGLRVDVGLLVVSVGAAVFGDKDGSNVTGFAVVGVCDGV